MRAALLAVIALCASCTADIRPPVIDKKSAQEERAASGRKTLEAAARAHGSRRWPRLDTTELVYTDTWYGIGKLFNPWPDDAVRVHSVQRTRSFDSTLTFLGGTQDGTTWAVHNGVATVNGAEVDDASVRFMLPTVQYFLEMPYRLLEAPIIRTVGPETIDGKTYDVVFVTWETVEATPRYDQYLIYVDQESGRIGKAKYTVREISRLATGTMHFEDYRKVDGVWVPFELTVTAEPTDPPDAAPMHQMIVEGLRHNSADPETLAVKGTPLPDELAAKGD